MPKGCTEPQPQSSLGVGHVGEGEGVGGRVEGEKAPMSGEKMLAPSPILARS